MRNVPLGDWATLVKKMREATGMTGAELSRRLVVDRATIWRWESGRQKPENAAIVTQFAELFGLDVDDALAAAGLRPNVASAARPTAAGLDPDVAALQSMLRDETVPDEVKRQARAMLRLIRDLANALPAVQPEPVQRPAPVKRSKPTRPRKAN